MKKYLILFIILIIAVLVISVSAKTIYVVKDSEGNVVSVVNQYFITQEQINKGYTIEVLFEASEDFKITPEFFQKVSNQENLKKLEQEIDELEKELDEKLENKPQANIKVEDWTNRLSDSGNYIYIEGIIKNTGKGTAKYVQMKVQGLDKYGKLVALETGYSEPSTIPPGKTATFQVMMTNYDNIYEFKLGSQWTNEP